MGEIIFEKFENIFQFQKTIANRAPNDVFRGHELSSETGDYSFTKTSSYQEADKLLQIGYDKGLKDLKMALIKSKASSEIEKSVPVSSIVGYAPHVPNAIAGIPNSMIFQEPRKNTAKVINILYSIPSNAHVDADQFVQAGKNMINVVYSLEQQGYRVSLDILCKASHSRGTYTFCCVNIKTWRQPSNLMKMSYPLIHPSFFRRHGFRWLETVPGLTERSYQNGYGRSVDAVIGHYTEDRRAWLREKGILKDNWFYTEREEAEENEADELIKLMGIA